MAKVLAIWEGALTLGAGEALSMPGAAARSQAVLHRQVALVTLVDGYKE